MEKWNYIGSQVNFSLWLVVEKVYIQEDRRRNIHYLSGKGMVVFSRIRVPPLFVLSWSLLVIVMVMANCQGAGGCVI